MGDKFRLVNVDADGADIILAEIYNDGAVGQVTVIPAHWCIKCARPIDTCIPDPCAARNPERPWELR